MALGSKVAVVGASARAAAFSLLRAGCQVVAADLFADADLERACPVTRVENYPEDFFLWLSATKCEGWLYTGALENYSELIDRMSQVRPLWGNAGVVLRQVRDPLVLQDTLTAAGLSFPETHHSDDFAPSDGKWLHKTGTGGGGSGVSRAESKTIPQFRSMGPRPVRKIDRLTGRGPMLRRISNRRTPLNQGFWQRHVTGTPGSGVFLADGRTCELVAVTRQLVGEPWTGAAEFQYCGTLAPWALPTKAVVELEAAGRILTNEFDLRGLFGIDFIVDEQRVWVIEVNPRVTAAVEVVELLTSRNLLAEHLSKCGSEVLSKQPTAPVVSAHPVQVRGKAILFAQRSITISAALSEQLLNEARGRENSVLADVPQAGTVISTGEPILSLLAEGVARKLAEQAALLHPRLQ